VFVTLGSSSCCSRSNISLRFSSGSVKLITLVGWEGLQEIATRIGIWIGIGIGVVLDKANTRCKRAYLAQLHRNGILVIGLYLCIKLLVERFISLCFCLAITYVHFCCIPGHHNSDAFQTNRGHNIFDAFQTNQSTRYESTTLLSRRELWRIETGLKNTWLHAFRVRCLLL